jgi:hypothetical protein
MSDGLDTNDDTNEGLILAGIVCADNDFDK